MVEYVSALKIRADSTSIPADFLMFAESALSLRELVDGFVCSALIEGVFSHGCYALRGSAKVHLFGGQSSAANVADSADWETLRFPITGWDEERYEVEMVLPAGRITDEGRACLHTMAVLYVCRGAALLEAADDLSGELLTARERYCLDQLERGCSFLDIGEELDCSAQAIGVHVQRAKVKLASAS